MFMNDYFWQINPVYIYSEINPTLCNVCNYMTIRSKKLSLHGSCNQIIFYMVQEFSSSVLILKMSRSFSYRPWGTTKRIIWYYIKESHVAEFKQWIQDMICCLSLKRLCSKKWGRGHIAILYETDFSLMFELTLYKPVLALIIYITLVALATFNLFNHPPIFSSFFFTVL